MKKYYIETLETRVHKYYVTGVDEQNALDNFIDDNHVQPIDEHWLDTITGETINHVELVQND